MILKEYVSENREEFFTKVANIAGKISIDPSWLMAVMYKESALNHRARNNYSNATGLIQFMPSTAIALGTTVDQLRQMTNIQQLDYVDKYFQPYRRRIKSYTDTYLAVFFPAAIGKPDDYILQTSNLSAGLIASQNPAVDRNKDGKITKAEVEEWALSGFAPAIQELLKKKCWWNPEPLIIYKPLRLQLQQEF